jgi:hypothetical protein
MQLSHFIKHIFLRSTQVKKIQTAEPSKEAAMRIITLGGVIEILLVVAHALFPSAQWLPLGGSEIAQLGIVFGSAVATAELVRLSRGRHVQ